MFIFKIDIPIKVVPKPVKLTRQHPKAQSPRAQRYIDSQNHLAQEFWLEMARQRREDGAEFPMPLAVSLRIDYSLVGRPHLDRANIEKAVEDALVKARVIHDDSIRYVPDARVSIFAGSAKHLLHVELRPIIGRRKLKP